MSICQIVSLLLLYVPGASAFVPVPTPTRHAPSNRKHAAPKSSRKFATAPRRTRLHNSAEQAEQFLSAQYPQFYYFLTQTSAMDRIRDSSNGYSVFALSDDSLWNMGEDRLGMLQCALEDRELFGVARKMALYHCASVPMENEIMVKYGVVSTPAGEVPVSLYASEEGEAPSTYISNARVIQSFRFQDRTVNEYTDSAGNVLGCEEGGLGKVCLVYEVEGMVCPDEMWEVLFECWQAKSS